MRGRSKERTLRLNEKRTEKRCKGWKIPHGKRIERISSDRENTEYPNFVRN